MKFKDLVEGKEYSRIYNNGKTLGFVYVKKEGLLYTKASKYIFDLSDYTFRDVISMNFEEIPPYVTLEEAVEHMKNGGKAKFEGTECRFEQYAIGYGYDCFIAIDMLTKFFEPKWQLL